MSRFVLGVFVCLLALCAGHSAFAYPLSLEQRERMKAYFPQTFRSWRRGRTCTSSAWGEFLSWGSPRWRRGLKCAWRFPGRLLSVWHVAFLSWGAHLVNAPAGTRAVVYIPRRGNHARRSFRLRRIIPFMAGCVLLLVALLSLRSDLVLIEFGGTDAIRSRFR